MCLSLLYVSICQKLLVHIAFSYVYDMCYVFILKQCLSLFERCFINKVYDYYNQSFLIPKYPILTWHWTSAGLPSPSMPCH